MTATLKCAMWILFTGILLEFWNENWAADTSLPRLRLSYKELGKLNRTRIFHGPHGFPALKTMLLDEYQERLFVGGRDMIYSLNLDQINEGSRELYWPTTTDNGEACLMQGKEPKECANYIRVLQHYNRTHLLACGTGAFDPVCAYVRVGHRTEDHIFELESHKIERGRGRCPFDPSSSYTSTLLNGKLFVGLYADYWGRDAALYRYTGQHSSIRTEPDNDRLLNEPRFVSAFEIPDTDDQDDDKVYFFFNEKAIEAVGETKAIYTRVGRVCVNDIGGQRTLVNRWSTFLKARLVCSVPGPNGIETHFDELEDVFLLRTHDERNPEIFALYSTTSNVFKGYAICVYKMAHIREAFNGPYAHKEGPEYQWAAYNGKVPFPRPGSCASKINGWQYVSSKEYPDEVLHFARYHPLMYRSIYPFHMKPVLLRTDGKYSLRQLAVDRVEAEDGQYDVLFIGTDEGIVLKVISIYNQEIETREEIILEELQVFKIPVSITSMEISVKRQQLYVVSEAGVAQMKLHQCDMYGTACADCCLARDPYCAWDGVSCSRYFPSGTLSKRRFRRQDVRHGDVAQQCYGQIVHGEMYNKTEESLVYGIENNSTLLECIPRSLQAKVLWFVQKNPDTRKQELKADDRVLKTNLGLLFLKLKRADAGSYFCQTVEHKFTDTIKKINLEILEEDRLEEMFHKEEDEEIHQRTQCSPQTTTNQGTKPWYKEFLQIIGYNNFQRIEEYCEKVWCSDKKRKKLKMLPTKWKNPSHQDKKNTRTKAEHYRMPRHTSHA
ncbi:semaphorin-3E [Protopterus annectens]|uniref:semaphorin-3E n=1 Tax=Protopterus annectens TaxID=7888 RepID=UPI001CF963DF|nr:semaphorin-3E [Protopterus annectens]